MPAKTYTYAVQRDYWDEEGVRVRKGSTVEATADKAQDAVEAGHLKRVKD